MPQIVPSAGFTPPCDYSNFAENFDLSLLPGGDLALSPSTLFYTQSPPPPTVDIKPKIFTTFYTDTTLDTDEKNEIDLGPDFQKLLPQSTQAKKQNLYPPSPTCGIYLEVPSSKSFHPNSPIGALSPYSPQGLLSPNEQFSVYPPTDPSNFYPNSPEVSLYHSSNSVYARSPRDDFIQAQFIKKENTFQNSPIHTYSPYHVKEEAFLSPCGTLSPPSPNYSNHSSPAPRNLAQIENNDVFELLENTLLDKQVKQESTVDFGSLLQTFTASSPVTFAQNPQTLSNDKSTPQDHQLLREVLRDTSFQRKFNIKPIDFGFIGAQIKMEEPDENSQKELINSCNDQLTRENMEPVLNLAIEQMRKDVDTTCAALSISSDPSQWTSANVLSWLQWTNREFGLPALASEQWDMTGTAFVNLTEDDFTKRAPQGGSILYAQLEIWKAACLDEDITMHWLPETASSNASSGGDVSEEEEEETPPKPLEAKPTTSRASGGSHIHLWQFLKELLASPQLHGSCIRWLDRTSGIFKIEDSVKVARLWGKRKNRPAMNYDKLSRSIRQYYKKGIMKKTERSQRLVYQFCHPYCL